IEIAYRTPDSFRVSRLRHVGARHGAPSVASRSCRAVRLAVGERKARCPLDSVLLCCQARFDAKLDGFRTVPARCFECLTQHCACLSIFPQLEPDALAPRKVRLPTALTCSLDGGERLVQKRQTFIESADVRVLLRQHALKKRLHEQIAGRADLR